MQEPSVCVHANVMHLSNYASRSIQAVGLVSIRFKSHHFNVGLISTQPCEVIGLSLGWWYPVAWDNQT